MAPRSNRRTLDDVRHDLQAEREGLASAADTLQESLRRATDVGGKLRRNLPAATAATLGAGFVLAGGIGATVRLLLGGGRKDEKARVGRFRIVRRH